jgi:hypothetical protein
MANIYNTVVPLHAQVLVLNVADLSRALYSCVLSKSVVFEDGSNRWEIVSLNQHDKAVVLKGKLIAQ